MAAKDPSAFAESGDAIFLTSITVNSMGVADFLQALQSAFQENAPADIDAGDDTMQYRFYGPDQLDSFEQAMEHEELAPFIIEEVFDAIEDAKWREFGIVTIWT